MADYAHEKTDKELLALERKIRREYDTARKEVQKKLNDYLAEVAKGEEKQRELLKAGKITKQEYNDWMTRKIGMGKRWEEMRDNLAQDMTNAGQIARSIADGYKPEVYALNHNWATYQIEHDGKIDTFYQLYDRQTVERLMEKDRKLMPPAGKRVKREIALGKAKKWNNKQLQSALTQSILQGESIPDMAKRVARTVATRSYADSVRYARTMITGAESAGRQDAYERAENMGIDLEKEWIATLDDRTRHTHRQLHGERRPLDEEFSNGCMYPADPSGDDEEVYNCRCTTKAAIKGFEGDRVESSPKMGGMSFEEWQGVKAPKETEQGLEFRSRFTEADSIKGAEDAIGEICDTSGFGALGVSYKGIELEVANTVNKTLIDLYDEFDIPKFGGIMAPAGNTKIGKQIEGATAAYSPIRNSFLLNRKSLGTMKAATKALEAEKEAIKNVLEHPENYHMDRMSKRLLSVINASKASGRATVPETIPDVLSHEFGHALEKRLRRMDNYDDIIRNMKDYAEKISGYATESPSEYIAESFASWRKGEKVADPLLIDAFKNLRRKP